MFQVFGETKLPPIKTTASPSEIANWKKKKEVSDCYVNLFQVMNSDSDKIVLERIIEKVLLSSEESQPQIQVIFFLFIFYFFF